MKLLNLFLALMLASCASTNKTVADDTTGSKNNSKNNASVQGMVKTAPANSAVKIKNNCDPNSPSATRQQEAAPSVEVGISVNPSAKNKPEIYTNYDCDSSAK